MQRWMCSAAVDAVVDVEGGGGRNGDPIHSCVADVVASGGSKRQGRMDIIIQICKMGAGAPLHPFAFSHSLICDYPYLSNVDKT